MTKTVEMTPEIQSLINQGAVFYISDSGGKDSQAMRILLTAMLPADQVVLVHADLGEVEWHGCQEHIKEWATQELNVVRGNWKDGTTKNLLTMVERRHQARPDSPPWPSSAMRYCTSDLKRDPIHKFIRRDMKARGASLGVNCTGLRSEESNARAKRQEFTENKRLSNLSRKVYEWLPIHTMLETEVFEVIAEAGQKPFWAYKENSRLSCVFCIMGCKSDLRHGAKQRPELAAKYIALELKTGYTMFAKESLADRIK
jgi:DNA sulfur modification protein DndC